MQKCVLKWKYLNKNIIDHNFQTVCHFLVIYSKYLSKNLRSKMISQIMKQANGDI